jgi:hypothetical protein
MGFPECDEQPSNAGCEDAQEKGNGERGHGNAWPGTHAPREELIENGENTPHDDEGDSELDMHTGVVRSGHAETSIPPDQQGTFGEGSSDSGRLKSGS